MNNESTQTEAEDAHQGLYPKYEVRKDGEPVENCFVLEPESDPAARRAIETYLSWTDNPDLADNLAEWLQSIETMEGDSDGE